MHVLSRAGLPLLFLAAFSVTDADAQRVKRLAEKAYDLSDYPEAVEMYERLLRKRPDDNDAKLRYARALRITGRLEAAREALASIDGSEDPEVAYQHALVLAELGRYPQAVEAVFAAAQLGHPAAGSLAARLEYAQAHQGDEPAWTVRGEFANGTGDDFAPVTIGDAVLFASRRNGDALQLYKATRDGNGFLRAPTPLHRVGAISAGDAPVAYSPSTQLAAYTQNNFAAGERLLPEAGWELSLALTLPREGTYDFAPGKAFAHNAPGTNTGFPAFSPDGKRLYFSSDRPGGMGGYDIYYSDRLDRGWSAPVNAGDKINTAGNEVSPYAREGALYFSSDYLPGFGGMDVYRADLVRGVASAVTNLGLGINSPLDDIGFALTDDERLAYVASNRAGGRGGMDLYRAERGGQAITLAVVDGKTGAPIPNAVFDFSDCGQGAFLTGADGEYVFTALPSLQCRPQVRKSGYNGKQFSLDAERLGSRTRLEIELNPEDKITIYEGKVVHSRTGDVVPDATVTAKHKRKDFTVDARTDARGRYTLGLEREGDYVIAYQAAGMAPIDREVSTYDRDGAGVLSTFAMFPAAGTGSARPVREMTTGDTPGVATVSTPYDKPSPSPSPSRKTRPTDTTPAARSSTTNAPSEATASPRPYRRTPADSGASTYIGSGYSVQVAALREGSDELAKYRSALASVGRVYGKSEGGLLKVRIGPYPDRAGASAVVSEVRRQGYPDAWVATESGGELMLRLATYTSLDNFDRAAAESLGTVTTRRSGTYVVALIAGFPNVAAARQQLARARAAGFTDAQVVRETATGTLTVIR